MRFDFNHHHCDRPLEDLGQEKRLSNILISVTLEDEDARHTTDPTAAR
jgi:hypothetical protein